MPNIISILEFAIYVENIELSADFYQKVLGFKIIEKDERLWALDFGNFQILLLCKKGASKNLEINSHDASGHQHLAFAINSNDLDAWRNKLSESKVQLEDFRKWARGGESLYFRDPDEHLIELATPGTWFIY